MRVHANALLTLPCDASRRLQRLHGYGRRTAASLATAGTLASPWPPLLLLLLLLSIASEMLATDAFAAAAACLAARPAA